MSDPQTHIELALLILRVHSVGHMVLLHTLFVSDLLEGVSNESFPYAVTVSRRPPSLDLHRLNLSVGKNQRRCVAYLDCGSESLAKQLESSIWVAISEYARFAHLSLERNGCDAMLIASESEFAFLTAAQRRKPKPAVSAGA